MSLDFNVRNIPCYDATYPPVDGHWNPVTHRLVWLMLAIEMTKITVENREEAFIRMRI